MLSAQSQRVLLPLVADLLGLGLVLIDYTIEWKCYRQKSRVFFWEAMWGHFCFTYK